MDKLNKLKTVSDVVKKAKQIIQRKDEKILFLDSIAKHAMDGREPILLQMPGSIKLENLNDIKITPPDIKFPDVQKVVVMESPEAKSNKWIPSLINHSVKSIIESIAKMWVKGIEITVSDEDKLRPQAVIVVDQNGRPVTFGSGGQIVIPMSHGGGVTPPPTVIGSGRKTVTTPGSAEKLISTITVCRKVILTAPAGNGGEVYVGDSSTSAVSGSQKGLLLLPTGSATIDIDDVSKVWIDATVAGEGVTFTYLR